jgi:drug/metabolite transporter (DMT)-like permease
MNDIVFAFLFQITIQHEQPDIFSFLGASLVMICTGSMALNKWRLEKKRLQQEKDRQDQQQQP